MFLYQLVALFRAINISLHAYINQIIYSYPKLKQLMTNIAKTTHLFTHVHVNLVCNGLAQETAKYDLVTMLLYGLPASHNWLRGKRN
jgi:hypothetical protein